MRGICQYTARIKLVTYESPPQLCDPGLAFDRVSGREEKDHGMSRHHGPIECTSNTEQGLISWPMVVPILLIDIMLPVQATNVETMCIECPE